MPSVTDQTSSFDQIRGGQLGQHYDETIVDDLVKVGRHGGGGEWGDRIDKRQER